MPLDATVRAR